MNLLKKILFGTFCYSGIVYCGFTQQNFFSRHRIYSEILGPGGLLGAGYEYDFLSDSALTLHLRCGLGTYVSSTAWSIGFPLEVIISGSRIKKITWESGVSLTPFLVSGKGRIDQKLLETGLRSTLNLFFRLGLRFRVTSAMDVRVAFHPSWGISTPTGPVFKKAFLLGSGFTPWGSMGLSYTLRKR